MSDLLQWGLEEAAGAIAARRVSSTELTQAAIAAAERLQPQLNCFIALDTESALAQAAAADAAIARGDLAGALHGVPLAHKDMYYRAGKVTTCGSLIRRDFRPTVTATALQRLAAAGAVNIGALNMAEFAFGPTGHNAHWGHCRNPWSTDHLTGGSSSGSGSAVAARIVYGALGSDTGGSIRVPAHLCGLVGLKPTWSLVSRFGAMPLSHSLDTVGPLTRTVRDAALITRLIAGADAADPTAARRGVPDYLAGIEDGVKGLRIGFAQGYFDDGLDAEIAGLLAGARETYGRLGAETLSVRMPDIAAINALCSAVISVDALTVHTSWLRSRPQDYSPQVRMRLQTGLGIPAATYLGAINLRAAMLRAFCDQVFSVCDALVVPSLAVATPTIAATDLGDSAAAPALLSAMTRCTRPFNYLGLPGLTVPMGFSRAGLPAGLQLVGRPFSEALLFRAGRAFERETLFHRQLPRAHA